MRKLKGGMRQSKLLCHENLSRGSVSHKGTPTSTLLKHSQRVLFLGHQVFSVNTITVTLASSSTKELHQKGWGSPRLPHKVVVAAPHQVGGSMTCRRASMLQRAGAPNLLLVHKRTTTQRLKALLSHSLRANIYTTLSKCAKD